MGAFDAVVKELEREAAITERVLQRVPEDRLEWRPHEKSMSLGQLALHIANTPGAVAAILAEDRHEFDPAIFTNQPQPASRQEVLDALQRSVAQAKGFVSAMDAERGAATWRLVSGPKELLASPRSEVMRTIMLNHWYHHRGQLTVYLRLLNVPVPVVYGRSADEG